jgi:hypothetical protein
MITLLIGNEPENIAGRLISGKFQVIQVPSVGAHDLRLQDTIQGDHAQKFVGFFPDSLKELDELIAWRNGMKVLRSSLELGNSFAEQVGVNRILKHVTSESDLDVRIDHRIGPVPHQLKELYLDVPVPSKQLKILLDRECARHTLLLSI